MNDGILKIMSTKVVTFKKEDKVTSIAKSMSRKRISCVVIESKGKPIGIITERDMISRVIAKNKNPEKLMAVDIMSYPVITVPDNVSIIALGQLMKEKKIRRVVVVKNDRICGIITMTNILEGMMNKIKHLNWQLVHTEISLDEYMDSLKHIQTESKKKAGK